MDLLGARPSDLLAILDGSSEALIAFDEDRRILHANARAALLFGHPASALDGASTDLLIPERFRQPDAPPMNPLPDVMQVDLPGVRRDGVELSVEWAFGSVATPLGAVFVMNVRDRAVAERAIDALRASEERFRLLVEGVREYAIFMLDPDGRVSSWNPGAERSKGWTADEILGQPYAVFFTPEDRAAGVPSRLLAGAAREGHQEISGWLTRKDGTRFRASAHLTALRSTAGELRGYAEVTRDLTERFHAEELERRLGAERAAREVAERAEERLRRVQRVTAALSTAATPLDVAQVVLVQSIEALAASAGALYALSADGSALELLDDRGHPPEAMSRFVQLPLDMRAPLTDAVREQTAGFYASFEECAQRYPDLRAAIGAGGFEASVALPLLSPTGVLGVLGLRFPNARAFSDSDRFLLLTLAELCAQALERARLLAAERLARADAERANRAKDEFLAMLGHELRNPLAPMVTALSLMTGRGSDEFSRERAILERQVSHLVHLVDDLLDVSRITQGRVELKRQRVDLASVVRRGIELVTPLLDQRRHHVVISVPDTDLTVDGDPTRLSQIVANLVSNSAKYTPPTGHIEVTGSRVGDSVVLRVRDDGSGIASEMLPRVFDLFVQEPQSIARSQGGLGLGLAIVKSLVALHEGKVSAFSEGHGKGSLFTVELPAAQPSDAPGVVESVSVPERSTPLRRRVLVVDDNTDAAETLSEWLTHLGHTTRTAHDGLEALEAVAQFEPEVVLLDIGLPVMDGFEVARRVRARGRDGGSPILVAVTGYGQAADRQMSSREGFHAHLVKPLDLSALDVLLDSLPQLE